MNELTRIIFRNNELQVSSNEANSINDFLLILLQQVLLIYNKFKFIDFTTTSFIDLQQV